MEIGFRSGPVADPAGGDPGIVLDRGSHRPTDGLDILRGEVSRKREEAVFPRRIENRHLPPLERVALVGEDLAHHVRERIAGGDQEPRLPVGWEVHVAGQERLRKGAAHGLLAHVLHVERGLALALRHQHASVEGTQRHHVAQAFEQFFAGEKAGPGAYRLAVAVENADDRESEVANGLRLSVYRWPRDRASVRDGNVREIGRVAGPDRRFRYVKPQGSIVSHRFACQITTLLANGVGRRRSKALVCLPGADCAARVAMPGRRRVVKRTKSG